MRPFITLLAFILSGSLLYAQDQLGDFRSVVTVGDWNVNTSWETFDGNSWVAASLPPTVGDNVITVRAGHTISFSSDEIIDQVVVLGTLKVNVGVFIAFPASPTGDAIRVDGTLDVLGGITQTANTVIRANGTLIARQGSAMTGSSATNLFFQANSTYRRISTSTPGVIPIAAWDKASTCLIQSTNSNGPANLNQSFGNVTFDCPSGGAFGLTGQLTTIRGNFTTTSNNTRVLFLATTTPYALNVNGNFTMGGGSISMLSSAGSDATISVGGNFTGTATGNIGEAGPGTGSLVFKGTTVFSNSTSLTFALDFVVSPGDTLDLGTSSLTGPGAFTLNSGSVLKLGSLNGPPNNPSGALVNGNLLGNIRVNGTRTYNSGSTIYYNGAAPQFLGNGHPTAVGITTVIDNPSGVTVSSNGLAFNGDLILNNGNLSLVGRSITFGGTLTPNGNALVGDEGTNITINDTFTTANFGTLKLAGTSFIGSLSLTGTTTGRVVSLGSDFAILNSLNLSQGDLRLNGFTLNIQGDATQTSGLLTGSSSSGLKITDEGVQTPPLDLNLSITGGTMNTITMNRIASTLTIPSNLTVSNLNLAAGTLTASGTLQMASNGNITVSGGILTNPVTAVTTYNVFYLGTSPIDTGAELPILSNILNNLTVSDVPVTLSQPATVNGALILNSGGFNSNGFLVTLNGNFTSNAPSDFVTGPSMGQIVFNGSTIMDGSIAPTFGGVTVNATKSLTITGNLELDIAADFLMNGSFTPGQSIVSLNGAVDQVINRTADATPISFYSLDINKTAGQVTLQSPADVQDVLSVPNPTVVNVGSNLLRLISNASRTARVNPLPVGANISGSVVVQRFLPNGIGVRTYRYLAPPVTNTFVSDWKAEIPITGPFNDPSTGPGLNSSAPSLFWYDETNVGGNTTKEERYRNYPETGVSSTAAPLVYGRGYAIFIRSAGTVTLDLKGTLGQQRKVDTVTAQTAGGANDGWNLVGNPFPSPIRWEKVTRSATVGNAMYLSDNTHIGVGSGFISVVGSVSVPANFDHTITSGQAFWVHATGTGTITFDETDKVISSDSTSQFYRQGPDSELLRLFLKSPVAEDEAVVRFLDDASDSFDGEFDALKFSSADLNLASRLTDGRDMVINTLGSLDCDKIIPLSVKNPAEGNYTFSATGIESFGSDVNLLLLDKETGQFVDLRTAGTYAFSVTSQNKDSLSNRFVLEIGKTRLVRDLPVSKTGLCYKDTIGTVAIQSTQAEVEYKAMLHGVGASDWTKGNGGNLTFAINVKTLAIGDNWFTILTRNICRIDSLEKRALIKRTSQPVVTGINDVLACQTGEAVLHASGASAGQFYSWFKSIDSQNPYEVNATGILALHNLTASTSFYVSIKDSIGCESERAKIDVKVVNFESLVIVEKGDTLLSNYPSGNTWFRDGVLIDSEGSGELIISQSGVYSSKVLIDGCVSQDSVVVRLARTHDDWRDFSIYPNPVTDQVVVHFTHYGENPLCIDIVSTSGIAIYTDCISKTGNFNYVIPAQSFAPGVYLVRVTSGNETISKRIIKI